MGIEKKDDGYRLTVSTGEHIVARFIVGADGCRSLVRRTFFGEEPPNSILARQYVLRPGTEHDTLQFRISRRYSGGYRWEFPYAEVSKIGFPHGTDEIEGEVIEGHARMIVSGGLRRIVQNNACLVGDAAGQSNSLTFAALSRR